MESRVNTESCQEYTVAKVQGDTAEPGMVKLHGRKHNGVPQSVLINRFIVCRPIVF